MIVPPSFRTPIVTSPNENCLIELVSVEVERMRRHRGDVGFELTAEACSVRGDPERLGRAIANVLGNAVKWSFAGDTIDVSVSSTTPS